jgi:hypothetical protein
LSWIVYKWQNLFETGQILGRKLRKKSRKDLATVAVIKEFGLICFFSRTFLTIYPLCVYDVKRIVYQLYCRQNANLHFTVVYRGRLLFPVSPSPQPNTHLKQKQLCDTDLQHVVYILQPDPIARSHVVNKTPIQAYCSLVSS